MQERVKAADIFFMRKALRLAEAGQGKVHPNPKVGAVVVRAGRLVGAGAHERFGGPHAEVNAIRAARLASRGATLYVTLEPCPHRGKTPPCTDLIIGRQISRVVIGAEDPNPIVAGRGISALKKAGLQVVSGVLKNEAEALNRDYNRWIRKHEPYVVLKFAQSRDGKIAGPSRWISSPASRRLAQDLRANADAILVGIGTVLADDPLLSVRLKNWRGRQPLKIVLDNGLRTPLKAKLFSKGSPGPVLIVTSGARGGSREKRFSKKAEVMRVRSLNGKTDLAALLKRLGRLGVVNLLVEGGAQVLRQILDQKLAQEVYCFIAPKRIGRGGVAGPFKGGSPTVMARALRIDRPTFQKIGGDILVRGKF